LSKEAGLVMIKSTYEQQRKRFGLSEVSDIFGEQKKNECTKLDSSILLQQKYSSRRHRVVAHATLFKSVNKD
jgi:hypothetical protein